MRGGVAVLRQLSCRSGSDMAAVVQPSWHNRSGTRWQNRRGEAVDPSSGGVAAVAGPPSRGCRAEAVEPRQWILGCRAKTVNSCRQAMAAKTWPSSRGSRAVAMEPWPPSRGRPTVAAALRPWWSGRRAVVMVAKPPCRSSGGEAAVELWPRRAVGYRAFAAKPWPPSNGRQAKTVAVDTEPWLWRRSHQAMVVKSWPPSRAGKAVVAVEP